MRFDGPFRHIQFLSDFRVVASLKKQSDNLPLPHSESIELFFHAYSWRLRPDVLSHTDSWAHRMVFVLLAQSVSTRAAKNRSSLPFLYKNSEMSHFAPIN
jgi:hypothetical protein